MKVKHSLLLVLTVVSGCAIYSGFELNNKYGAPKAQNRIVQEVRDAEVDYWHDVKPVLDNRCVVCHGCYDAPCQLKLSAPEGIDRGASKNKVFDTRVLSTTPTRLFEDAQSTEEWRHKEFFPVLNEREQTAQANLEGSVMARVLTLKQKHPSPVVDRLPESMDFSLDRAQQCASIEEFDRFEKKNPLWGMPFGLPGLNDAEHDVLMRWMQEGARYSERATLSPELAAAVKAWETFFNEDSLKHQLMSRYIYEHLFLGHLYFPDISEDHFFQIVRSRTPPGQVIDLISTSRPYEDPKVDRVYYRLQASRTTRLSKTHMPYALNANRMARYRELFLEPDYTVEKLPGYVTEIAANPFIAFQAIPTKSRYKFMLDEAKFTIMGFIKNSVCRGQIALSVIDEQFWVMFIDPEVPIVEHDEEFLARESDNLRIPSEQESDALVLKNWIKYAEKQIDYLKAKTKTINAQIAHKPDVITLDLIWNGDGHNKNAALTVFRHFDSASVVNGFVGDQPKTAWVLGYPLLERIHYLLVAGFDVYGNVGHQLNTRLYMDFLRMEGESHFLTLLPKGMRKQVRDHWYRNALDVVKDFIYGQNIYFDQGSGIEYITDNPKAELFFKLREYLADVLERKYDLDQIKNRQLARELRRLSYLQGTNLSWLPEVSFLTVKDDSSDEYTAYSLIHNSAHANIAHLFGGDHMRLTDEDTLTVVKGFIGDYPNAFFDVQISELSQFVKAVKDLKSEKDYQKLLSAYGIRRTHPNFWVHSDKLHTLYKKTSPLEFGMFDYNRLENR